MELNVQREMTRCPAVVVRKEGFMELMAWLRRGAG